MIEKKKVLANGTWVVMRDGVITRTVERSTSRKRSTPLLKIPGGEAVRTRTWFWHVIDRALPGATDKYVDGVARRYAGLSSDLLPNFSDAMQAWLNERMDEPGKLSDKQVGAVNRLAFSNYEYGFRSPTDMTLEVFEKFLPATSEIYIHGPYGLPLWALLDGDAAAAAEFLKGQFTPLPGQFDLSLSIRAQLVFDKVIAKAYRVDIGSVPNVGEVQTVAHPVWISHINTTRGDTFSEEDADQLLGDAPMEEAILCALALWRLAVARREGPILELEWLVMGLCNGVIAYHFNDEIQACVLALIAKHSAEVDTYLMGQGSASVNFAQRWTTVIALSKS